MNAPHPRAIGNCCALGRRWGGSEGGRGAGRQARCSALLLPRPEGWFIFRFKSQAFLSALLKLPLGAGGRVSRQCLGTSLGKGGKGTERSTSPEISVPGSIRDT